MRWCRALGVCCQCLAALLILPFGIPLGIPSLTKVTVAPLVDDDDDFFDADSRVAVVVQLVDLW